MTSHRALWDDARRAQPGEEVEEAVIRRLIVEEAKFSTLAHVGNDLDRAPKVGVGVPG